MNRRYLLIGVVAVAGLLIVAAIITANTNYGDRQRISALSETKTGFSLPAKTVDLEFNEYLAQKGMTRQELKKFLKDSGYDHDYFYKKFENRVTVDRYLNDRVLSGLTNDLEKRQRYSDWFNNARLLAKVIYYDKNLETIVKNSSAAGGCGNSCSTKQTQS